MAHDLECVLGGSSSRGWSDLLKVYFNAGSVALASILGGCDGVVDPEPSVDSVPVLAVDLSPTSGGVGFVSEGEVVCTDGDNDLDYVVAFTEDGSFELKKEAEDRGRLEWHVNIVPEEDMDVLFDCYDLKGNVSDRVTMFLDVIEDVSSRPIGIDVRLDPLSSPVIEGDDVPYKGLSEVLWDNGDKSAPDSTVVFKKSAVDSEYERLKAFLNVSSFEDKVSAGEFDVGTNWIKAVGYADEGRVTGSEEQSFVVEEEKFVLSSFQIGDIETDERRRGVVGIFSLPDTSLVQRVESGVFGDVPESEIVGLEGHSEVLVGVYAINDNGNPDSFTRFERVRVGSNGRIDMPDEYRVLSYNGLAEIGITPEEFRDDAIRVTEGIIKRYEGPVNFYIMQTGPKAEGDKDYNKGFFDEEIQKWISAEILQPDGLESLFNHQIGQVILGKDNDLDKHFSDNGVDKNWIIVYADTTSTSPGWGGSSDKDEDGFLDSGTASLNLPVIRNNKYSDFDTYLKWTFWHEGGHASGLSHSYTKTSIMRTTQTPAAELVRNMPRFEEKIVDLRYDPTVQLNGLTADYLNITEGF